MEQHQNGEFIFINPRMTQDQFDFASDPLSNPYKGLNAYQSEDANLFFGREEEVLAIKEKLSNTEILFVSGPSGSGKSSLIKAGLFPALTEIAETITIRPSELMTKTQTTVPDELSEFDEIKNKLADESKRYVLLFDQFEELFSLPDKTQVIESIQDLWKSAKGKNNHLIFTLRSDYEWQLRGSFLGTEWKKREYLPGSTHESGPIAGSNYRACMVGDVRFQRQRRN